MHPNLFKAARALIDWSQRDLAKASGISLAAIKNFECGKETARPATIAAITAALETNGVEFLASGGVRHIDDVTSFSRYTGDNFIQMHDESMYASVRASGSEILTCTHDDALWKTPCAAKANEQFIVWCKRLNISEKVLIPEGGGHINIARQHYRMLPPALIGKVSYVIYADRISFLFWKKKQTLILRNHLISETFRQQFKHLWRLGKAV